MSSDVGFLPSQKFLLFTLFFLVSIIVPFWLKQLSINFTKKWGEGNICFLEPFHACRQIRVHCQGIIAWGLAGLTLVFPLSCFLHWGWRKQCEQSAKDGGGSGPTCTQSWLSTGGHPLPQGSRGRNTVQECVMADWPFVDFLLLPVICSWGQSTWPLGITAESCLLVTNKAGMVSLLSPSFPLCVLNRQVCQKEGTSQNLNISIWNSFQRSWDSIPA